MRNLLAVTICGAALAGCATTPAVYLPAATVVAKGETEPVGTANEDAADDPAIWRHPSDPAQSLIVGTDKKAGLHVYGMDGRSRFFIDAGQVNNVDLVDLGAQGVIVVASDRNDLANAMLQVYRLDTDTAELRLLGKVAGGAGEGYGLCLGLRGDALLAYSVLKQGAIHEVRIALGGEPTGTPLRVLQVPTQPEGCVVDPRDGTLYVGEEVAGIWRFPAGSSTGEIVAPVDNEWLVADVEGLAIAPQGEEGGYLVASSQGDNAYVLFRLPGMEPVGRVRVAAGEFGSTEETDGIELDTRSFGPNYPGGLFIAQDGHNQPEAQNFKLVSWADILAALGEE